jgi:large subunit ribosomal protein L25
MAEANVLHAEQRTERGSRPAGRLRRAGKVPAVVYGLESETLAVTVPARELAHMLSGGANTLITLKFDDGEALALARQVQRHPTRGDYIHVDFVRVSTDVAVAAEVPLSLVGESAGVLDGGILEQLVFTLSIEAKPQDIPTEIEHDISALEIGDQLRVAELVLPAGVATTLEPEALIVQVAMPRVEEEAAVEVELDEDGNPIIPAEGGEGEAGEAEASAEGEGEGGGSDGDSED